MAGKFFKFTEYKDGEKQEREYIIDVDSISALSGGVQNFVSLSNGNRIEMSDFNYQALKSFLGLKL